MGRRAALDLPARPPSVPGAAPRPPGVAPAGARAFATDPEHYDIDAENCVKDLKPLRLPRRADRSGRYRIRFTRCAGRGFVVLTISYQGVRSVEIADDDGGRVVLDDVNTVRLDEVLPHEDGCSHELRLTSATVRIVCADLVAEWVTPPWPPPGRPWPDERGPADPA